MLPFIQVGSVTVSAYWTMFFVGVIALVVMNILRRTQLGFSAWGAVLFSVYISFCGVAGAKALFLLENLRNVLEQGFTVSGVSFFGALFFVPVGMFAAARVLKRAYADLADASAPSVLLMLSCLRIGCFLNGCCGGIATDLFGIRIESLPTQLMELALDLLILFAILRPRKEKLPRGSLYPILLAAYGAGRFLIEFLRVRTVLFWQMSEAHLLAIISAIAGMAMLTFFEKKC